MVVLSGRVDGSDAETVVEDDLEMGDVAAAMDETETVTIRCAEDVAERKAVSDKAVDSSELQTTGQGEVHETEACEARGNAERMGQSFARDLVTAAKDGDLTLCKMLCEFGADLGYGYNERTSAMVAAADNSHYEILRYLITHPKYHRKWDNALFKSWCARSPQAVVEYLNLFTKDMAAQQYGTVYHLRFLGIWDAEDVADVGLMSGVSYRHLKDIYGLPECDVADTALALVINTPVAREALAGKLMRYIIKAKWLAFGKTRFRQEVFLYTALIVAFSISIVCNQATTPWHAFEGTRQHVVGISRILAAVVSAVLLVRVERQEAIVEGLDYFFSFWNLLGAGTYIGIIVITIYQATGVQTELLQVATGVLNITLWINMYQYLQMTERFAVLVAMMSHMVDDVAKFILLYTMFLFGFSGGFYVVLLGNPGYETFVHALITVLLMLFGQTNYDPFKTVTGLTWIVANLLLLVYLVSVVIVLLNLLIAMMSTSYDNVWDKAESQVLLSYAQTIVRMEKSIMKADRKEQVERLMRDKYSMREKYRHARSRTKRLRGLQSQCEAANVELSDFGDKRLVARMVVLVRLFGTNLMLSLARLLGGSTQSVQGSPSSLAWDAITDCSTLEDGERWEVEQRQTASDQQGALYARVEDLTSLVERQTALIQEQSDAMLVCAGQRVASDTTAETVTKDEVLVLSMRVDQLTTVVEQQTALIMDLAGLLRGRDGTEATI